MRRSDIEQVLSALGCGPFTYSGAWVTCGCPLAPWTHEGGTDRRPSFGVREGQGVSAAHCFACGFNGGVISLLREYGRFAIKEGLTTKERIDELVDFVLLAEDDTGDLRVGGMLVEQPVVVPQDIEDCLDTSHPYFEERGIDEETARTWRLGWHPMEERVMFPVVVREGRRDRVVGVVGRTVGNEEPKYRNYPPRFRKSEFLYGEWLKPGDADVLVVAEGPIDVIRVNMALMKQGMADAWCVGLMGAEPSKAQLDRLVALAREVVVMTDNDASGRLAKAKIVGGRIGDKKFDGVSPRCLVSAVVWPDEVKDAGDLEDERICELVDARRFVLEERLEKELGWNR